MTRKLSVFRRDDMLNQRAMISTVPTEVLARTLRLALGKDIQSFDEGDIARFRFIMAQMAMASAAAQSGQDEAMKIIATLGGYPGTGPISEDERALGRYLLSHSLSTSFDPEVEHKGAMWLRSIIDAPHGVDSILLEQSTAS